MGSQETNNVQVPMFPVLPLRNMVMMPHIVTPILVGRPASLEAVETAFSGDKRILCITEKEGGSDDDPKAAGMYRIGTLCMILQVFRLPDGNVRVLVEGKYRFRIDRFQRLRNYMVAAITPFPPVSEVTELEMEALLRSSRRVFLDYVQSTKNVPEEALIPFRETHRPEEFLYFILANTELDISLRQEIFEMDKIEDAILRVFETLRNEIEIHKLEMKIDGKVKDRLGKLQREYYLNEQLKIIHKELGVTQEEQEDFIAFKEKAAGIPLNDEARKRVDEELKKLSRLTTHSQEYGVVYNYINWILDLPWGEPENPDFDIEEARQILEEDHYGLEKVKDRILEFLAVIKLAGQNRGQILCFVGPPGVGKTSLGKSIARALKRRFVRISLGGVRDEAEIRGHRRTYIGALPGVIIQSMKKAGTVNPLIMMDEVDKMSVDFRGDPSAALLEVLDAEQNSQFRDHYLDFEYDLSKAMFITTANTLNSIPQPLLDRMEIIRIPGYTAVEKKHIATRHLLPKQIEAHRIDGRFELNFSEPAIRRIIDAYTREAGVRELERNIASVIRKIVREFVEQKVEGVVSVDDSTVERHLGVPKFLYSDVNDKDRPGVVTGLAWTASGGETLQIEVIRMKGEGKILLTGKLGDVMRESAQAAFSWARFHAEDYGLEEDFHKKYDLHLHIPEGAIPKDGPSAGIAITTAMVSALSGMKVDHDLAMTGEITLSGNVLPIGGLEEKLIAAKRAGIGKVIIPGKNRPHLSEVKEEAKSGLEFVFADKIEEVLEKALIRDSQENPATGGQNG